MQAQPTIAYFSMEIGLNSDIPTYSGGLGVLAGDTVFSAADLGIPMVAVTLLHRNGYFYQALDAGGNQREEPCVWAVQDFLRPLDGELEVQIDSRIVYLRAWEYKARGLGGSTVPVYFLDADDPRNSEADRQLTGTLYGGDSRYRVSQEVVLGMGGVRLLRTLGYHNVARFHLNEGHASFLTLELLSERLREAGRSSVAQEDIEAVRSQCVFTTHTPVPAGHDQFPVDLVRQIIGDHAIFEMPGLWSAYGKFNMTYLALNFSHYVNGVAKRHGELSQHMFAQYQIDSITNGVHAARWASPSFQALFDRHIPDWRGDNASLRYALSISSSEIWQAHQDAKCDLLRHVNRQTNAGMDAEAFTIGFGRRATAYKRPDLLFSDTARLRRLAGGSAPLQIIYAGKAHPRDEGGKEIIRAIHRARDLLKGSVKVVYLANYAMDTAKLMAAGVDLWLNTPKAPMEASGTSGMKAALNGVPSLSILDGWWIEGCLEGVTGWSIESPQGSALAGDSSAQDAASLYDKLERIILPIFYHERDHYAGIMRHSIALNGSFFNTQRMMQQYVLKAYFR